MIRDIRHLRKPAPEPHDTLKKLAKSVLRAPFQGEYFEESLEALRSAPEEMPRSQIERDYGSKHIDAAAGQVLRALKKVAATGKNIDRPLSSETPHVSVRGGLEQLPEIMRGLSHALEKIKRECQDAMANPRAYAKEMNRVIDHYGETHCKLNPDDPADIERVKQYIHNAIEKVELSKTELAHVVKKSSALLEALPPQREIS